MQARPDRLLHSHAWHARRMAKCPRLSCTRHGRLPTGTQHQNTRYGTALAGFEGRSEELKDRTMDMIPSTKFIRGPLLSFLRDKKTHSLQQTMRYLVDHFGLTEAEQRLRTPSGKLAFYTRVVGTVSRLRESGLLKNTSVGKFKITEEGIGFLNSRPAMNTKPRQRTHRTSGSHQLTLTPDPENPLEVMRNPPQSQFCAAGRAQ